MNTQSKHHFRKMTEVESQHSIIMTG